MKLKESSHFLRLLNRPEKEISSIRNLLNEPPGYSNRKEIFYPEFLNLKENNYIWSSEPDEIVWFEKTIFGEVTCVIMRNPESGTLGGYVYIPSDSILNLKIEDKLEHIIFCHGGLVYDSKDKNKDFRLIGFETYYHNDFKPFSKEILKSTDKYRTIPYVYRHIFTILEQLAYFMPPRK